MPVQAKRKSGEEIDTRSRITQAAQQAFSERGYQQTRVSDVAQLAAVAPSLVIKYFGTKASLFRAALELGLSDSGFNEELKKTFGEKLIRAVADPHLEMFAPAMMALSLGDQEAREITAEVVSAHVTGAIAEWLGPPDAQARAASIFMLSTGFAIFNRHLEMRLSEEARRSSSAWLVEKLAELIDPRPCLSAHADAAPPALG